MAHSKTEKVSKFGGKPDVERESFSWPLSNNKPMAFLAQIDLSEVSKQVKFDWLPKKGVLLFFYDVLEMPWDLIQKTEEVGLLFTKIKSILQLEFPDNINDIAKIKQSYIEMLSVDVLPQYDDPSVKQLNLSYEEEDLYMDLQSESSPSMPDHQIGGFASPRQNNNMQLEAQLVSNGIYVGDSKGYESHEAKALESGAEDWQLLFQFDTDDDLEIMWGDTGTIYFWIQNNKSILKQFDNTWLVLQCL